jgi:hypothetical protein
MQWYRKNSKQHGCGIRWYPHLARAVKRAGNSRAFRGCEIGEIPPYFLAVLTIERLHAFRERQNVLVIQGLQNVDRFRD